MGRGEGRGGEERVTTYRFMDIHVYIQDTRQPWVRVGSERVSTTRHHVSTEIHMLTSTKTLIILSGSTITHIHVIFAKQQQNDTTL